MARPHLLLVPSFTKLEWGIRSDLEQWAEVAAFDTPGLSTEALPEHLRLADFKQGIDHDALMGWRDACAARGLAQIDTLGWERFVVVADSHGAPTAVRIVEARRDAVRGFALGHASLSQATEGERAPMRAEVWAVLGQLASQGRESFVRYGLAQMTRGGVDDELAAEMVERFHDMDLVAAMVDALGREPEPVGDQLAEFKLPLLFAKHEGCLGRTDEGFEDIVAAFPGADTVICPETCASSPAFAEALKRFCASLPN
jgi:pimeloyl-ACP methyl ester carboxylesterase